MVKVLLSSNFNNFECHRPVAADSTDDEYRKQFEKAIELADAARSRVRQMSETERMFRPLCREYQYLTNMAETFAVRDLEADPLNDTEKELLKKYHVYVDLFAGYRDTNTWEQMLYDAVCKQIDGQDEIPY